MFKNEEEAYRIVDCLRDFGIPACFGIEVEDDYGCPEAGLIEEYLNDNLPYSVSVDNGISKFVIIPDDQEWVLKIPFNGFWNCCEWNDFYGADCDGGKDYCRAELNTYITAVRLGIGPWFARTALLTDVGNTFVYIQEKVIPENSNQALFCRASKASRRFIQNLEENDEVCKEMKYVFKDSGWLAVGADTYSQDSVKMLLEYFRMNPQVIRDMHGGNYGYRADGTPALLDFSDYQC